MVRVPWNSPDSRWHLLAIWQDLAYLRLWRSVSSRHTRSKGNAPFRIAWIATDTSLSFNALATGAADLSITYHAYAEKIALRQGIADRCVYAWRDHFMLVGKTHPSDALQVK